MEVNRYTPATIGQHQFSIPLYQRLFEWEEEQVNQLLQDLYASFKENEKAPYYIGVLTVYKSSTQDRYSLVDGQQRFTVLMLLSIVLCWEDFSLCNNKLRLAFFARKNDEAYLKAKVEKSNPEQYINAKMEAAINAINSFLKNQVNTNCLEEFKQFIKEKTTFFITALPENYSSNELNRYFEAMNEAGKGLENHEILKVQLLKRLKEEDFNHCTKIWNEVSQMDKCLIQQKENESIQDYNKRNIEAFKNPEEVLESSTVNHLNTEKISSIEPSKEKPQESSRKRDEGALLDFQQFLLLVLSLTVDEEISFDKNKLLTTFEVLDNSEKEVDIKSFFDNLLKYRLLFDYFIIKTTSLDGRTTTYTLNYTVEEDQSKQALIHYQSMLYVSTSYYIWLKPLLIQLLKVHKDNQSDDFRFLDHLKTWDNKRHGSTNINLNYGSINRYWFWRLDYYLWERTEEFFKNKAKEIANHYIFRANRSIEHIAPQTPKDDSNVKLKDEVLHLFGNLAMISSGQNSSLQNASYEVKKAHIESFINGSVGGSIESLKLLKILEFETWNENNVKQHHNEMVNVLIDSFPENTAGRDVLEKLTIKDYAQ